MEERKYARSQLANLPASSASFAVCVHLVSEFAAQSVHRVSAWRRDEQTAVTAVTVATKSDFAVPFSPCLPFVRFLLRSRVALT